MAWPTPRHRHQLCCVLSLAILRVGKAACEGAEGDDATGSCLASPQPKDSVLQHLRPNTRCEPYSELDPRYHFPRSGALWQKQIPVGDASDIKRKGFWESEHYRSSKPVLIRGAAEDVFRDFPDAWSIEALLRGKHAEQKLPVSLGGRISQSNTAGSMTVQEILDMKNQTVSFFNIHFEDLQPEAADVHWQGFSLRLHKEYFKKLKKKSFIRPKGWERSSGGQFNLHVSRLGGALPHSHNPVINVLFQGAKRWILVGPEDIPANVSKRKFERMDVQPFNSPDKYNAFQWFKDVAAEMPLGMPFYDFVQEEGEAVYVPPMYTHATVDLCSVTFGAVLGGEFLTGQPARPKGKGRR